MKKTFLFLDENFEKITSVACLAAMSIIICVQVFCRYVLSSSLTWSEEIARYLFVWLSYFATSYGVKESRHICVDAIHAMLSGRHPKAAKIYTMISYIVFLVFALIMIYYGVMVVSHIAGTGQTAAATHIPMQFVYAAPAVGFALCSYRLIQNFVKGVKELRSEG